jgi:hypothetical protein
MGSQYMKSNTCLCGIIVIFKAKIDFHKKLKYDF